MKYESAILKRLIDTYGVVGNPKYMSEIIKQFIVQGKECFPNLFTYQSDWLAHIDEFGLNPTYTVTYTGQSIYAPNTLERPVKSAILKGNTGYRDIDTGEFLETFEEGRNLELVSVKMPVLKSVGKNLCDCDFELGSVCWDSGVKINSNTVVRNTTPIKVIGGDTIYITGKTKHAKDCKYIFEYDGNMNFIRRIQNDDGKALVLHEATRYINMRSCDQNVSGDDYVMLPLNEYKNVIMVSNTTTPYEPYKSNILTVNDDVELRGVGDVQDTLDCLTGELTQRVSGLECINQNSKLSQSGTSNDTTLVITTSLKSTSTSGRRKLVASHELIKYAQLDNWYGNLSIIFRLPKSNENFATLANFKQYLSQNPFYYYRELEENEISIKTVDLTILDQNGQNVKQFMAFNGGTHFNTGSLEGTPLPSVSVSVETDLEETLAVCSLEGNTM